MQEPAPFSPKERKVVDAFLQLLTAEEFAELAEKAFPKLTGCDARLREAIEAEHHRRRRARPP